MMIDSHKRWISCRGPTRCLYHRLSLPSLNERPFVIRSGPVTRVSRPTRSVRHTRRVLNPMWGVSGIANVMLNRNRERSLLDQLLADVRGGESRALVVRGDAGIGKTALLHYVLGQASDCRVARAAGI